MLRTPVLPPRSMVRVRTCSARRWPLSRFSPFSSPSPVSVHYMPLEECRRGAAKRVNACSGARTESEEETRLFFWVQFFAQRLHGELHVSASFFTYRWQRHDWSVLITSTYFQKALNYSAIGPLPHAWVSNMSILSTLGFVYTNQVFPSSNKLLF